MPTFSQPGCKTSYVLTTGSETSPLQDDAADEDDAAKPEDPSSMPGLPTVPQAVL